MRTRTIDKMNEFATLLRTFRVHKDLTQMKLAKRTKMNQMVLSQLERGHALPPSNPTRVTTIAKGLNLTRNETKQLQLKAYKFHLNRMNTIWGINA